METQQTQLDQSVVNLAKAIKMTETGGTPKPGASGETGRYQFMPGTWNSLAGKYLGDPNAQHTNVNENKVAYYHILDLKNQGYTPPQIASIWNSGKPDWQGNIGVNKQGVQYNTPDYVNRVYQNWKSITGRTQPSQTQGIQQPIQPTLTPAQQSAQTSAQQYKPLVAATPQDTLLTAPLKTISNIPSSAFNFIKGAIDFLNPLNTAKTLSQIPQEFQSLIKEKGGVTNALVSTIKELPDAAYQMLVPQATKQIISGDTQGAQMTLENDPVGQILPYILLGKGIAEKTGVGPQFDAAIKKVASPVTKVGGGVGSYLAQKAGTIGSQILGTGTGAGAQSIRSAMGGSSEFVNAMRGNITPEETVGKLEDAFNSIKEQRRSAYVGKLEQIAKTKGSLNISPIVEQLRTQLNNFRVKIDPKSGALDFSESPIRFDKTAQSDIKNIYDTMQGYGTKTRNRTPLAVDSLKRAFGDLYSQSSNVRAFIQSMKSTTADVLKKQVPGYLEMTSGYEKMSNLLNDIKSATSLGGKANADTVFTKVTTALKSDKEFRLQMLNELENGSGQKLIDALAGHNLQKWIPSGLIGRGIDAVTAYEIVRNAFNPSMIPLIMTTSPRIVGEFLNALGVSKKYVAPILSAINNLPESVGLSGRRQEVPPTETPLKTPVAPEVVKKPIATISTDPLIQEAKKYKSAEEFVKARISQESGFKDTHSAPSFDDTPIKQRMEDGGDFSLSEVIKGKSTQPSDYLDPKVGARYYGYDTPAGQESYSAIRKIMDGQSKTITAYRAVPKDIKVNTLENGEWITFSKKYAEQHGISRFNGNYKIIKQEVKPSEVWWDGNDINEWGYDNGKGGNRLTQISREKQLTDIWNKAHSISTKSNSSIPLVRR